MFEISFESEVVGEAIICEYIVQQKRLAVQFTSEFLCCKQIPKSVTDKASPAFNKGHIAVHGSKPVVAEAFAEASRKDMQKFFKCRAEEMAPGGLLALYCTGRQERAHPENQYPDNTIIFMLHLEKAMKELVNEVNINQTPI